MIRKLLTIATLHGLLASDPADAAGITHRFACVQAVLGTDVAPPEIVVLRRSEMYERFGSDGYYRDGVAYWHANASVAVTVRELARHALAQSGDEQDEVRLRQAMRRCG